MLCFTLSCVCYIINGHGSQSLHRELFNTLVTNITKYTNINYNQIT